MGTETRPPFSQADIQSMKLKTFKTQGQARFPNGQQAKYQLPPAQLSAEAVLATGAELNYQVYIEPCSSTLSLSLVRHWDEK